MPKDRLVWLEVALNGGAGQKHQPNIPILPNDIIQEGIAAGQAGAGIVHAHVYDPDSGKPTEDADLYAQVIEGIREHVDVIVYPTIALAGSIRDRFATVEELAKRGLLEWAALDPGTVTIIHRRQTLQPDAGFIYSTPIDHIRHGLTLAAEYRFHPSFAIYEPGFVRLGAALASAIPNLPQPIYRVMLSADYLFGLPPQDYALDAYQAILSSEAPTAPRMVSGLGGDVMTIAKKALTSGFHLRVGLEDAPLRCERNNSDLIQEAVELVDKLDLQLASADQIRNSFEGTPHDG